MTDNLPAGITIPILIAVLLVGSSFILQGNIGLNIADEGYLWYGMMRTAEGDTPLFDFQSYDPGRYYWSATFSILFGKGILALRLSLALFQGIGLFFGLLAAKRVVKNNWALVVVGILLVVWMYPRHKYFEHSISLIAVYLAVRLIEKPVFKRYFLTGVFIGLAAFFGSNHGLYNFLAFLFLILFIWMKKRQGDLSKRVAAWFAGIVTGYMPMLIMLAFTPGMFEQYLDKNILVYFQRGHTNIPLAVPWPWSFDYSQMELFSSASAFFIGMMFLLLPLFYIAVIACSLMLKPNNMSQYSLIIASSFVGVFYLHHAFSRADAPHLASVIQPFLLGAVALLCLLFARNKRICGDGLGALLLLSTMFGILPFNPIVEKVKFPDRYINYNLNGDQLRIPKGQAHYLEIVRQFVEQNVLPEESIFLAPYFPALYPILQRKSPTYDTYMVYSTRSDQETIISDLTKNKVNWVLLEDFALDRRDDLRFRNTHTLVWQYIMREFEPIETPGLPSNQRFLHRRNPF